MARLRLLPVLIFAVASLLALKAVGLLTGHGYLLSAMPVAQAQDKAPAKRSWAQEMLGYPEVTGSVDKSAASAPPPKAAASAPATPKAEPGQTGLPATGTPVSVEDKASVSVGERAVLERLQERRQELEARGRELDVREGLLKAAEKRLEIRIEELKALEAQVDAAVQKKDKAEAARFKALVTMYENMKAKEAARIFDRLEPKVLLEVAGQISPRRMSEILAQMSPDAAERLTTELAAHRDTKGASLQDLPKIEGRPRH